MARQFEMPKRQRPRQFWLRGLAFCWVLLMAELAVFALLVMHSAQATHVRVEERFAATVYDVPVVNYPQYRQMMTRGVVLVARGGDVDHIRKTDFTQDELRKLGLMLRAE